MRCNMDRLGHDLGAILRPAIAHCHNSSAPTNARPNGSVVAVLALAALMTLLMMP